MRTSFWIVVLLLATVFYGLFVIKDFRNPITDWGDTDVWEYYGYYFAKNLSFSPLPTLDLVNNQLAYPYGTNQALQDWAVERELFYAFLYRLMGTTGPYLQMYLIVSVLLIAFGVFGLLRPVVGNPKAGLAAGVMAFCNFYAIHKYPGHLAFTALHWTTLSLVTDWLLGRRVWLQQPLTLRFLLVKALFLALVLGQNLGYVAGYALSGFSLTTLFCMGVYLNRRRRVPFRAYISLDPFVYRGQHLLLLTGIVAVAFLYIPLVLQIAAAAKSLQSASLPMGIFWDNPLRLWLPLLPGISPYHLDYQPWLRDSTEGMGPSSPGLFLTALGLIGFFHARNKAVYLPLLVLMGLCLLFHTTRLPTLRIFPWFLFTRVSSRATLIYPVILTLLALSVEWKRLPALLRAGIIALALAETGTAYQAHVAYFNPVAVHQPFYAYMNTVKQTPGEAVLDWPFCALGDNGLGEDLCPFFYQTSGTFALRRFHDKKVMGFFLGRLHPAQIAPFEQANWPCLFMPNNPNLFKATRQRRCFTGTEMQRFADFFAYNDFCGINLYPDLLAPGCEEAFYQRFGRPVAETELRFTGRVVFIPKPDSLRRRLNPALGKRIRLACQEDQAGR
ncbi:hypothetical protein GCM10023187_35650 [Nibrella viscosa]|uniref:Glycosyltransferase RgtA/B/C/D-like domain-containing protein n=1 Tax=Nibrella viscosa TaxID=1084524 RepID=A0ABP8KM89_9BACT